jgi:hypothetical protein
MEDRQKKVELRSLSKNKFAGLALYPYSSGVVLTPQIGKTGYKTGLTKEEETQFEEVLNLKKGELARKNGDFWHMQEVRIKNKVVLDLSDDNDYLKFRWLTDSTRVCPSLTLVNKYPNAEYVLIDEQAEAKKESIDIDWEVKAMEHFMSLSTEEKRGILKLYGSPSDNVNEDMVKTALYKKVKIDFERFVKTIEDKDRETRIFIEELLEHDVVTKQKNFYKNGDDTIGNTTDDVLEYLKNPKNSSIIANFKSRLIKAKSK